MKSIILAGGSGTRLWPLSRKGFPKQFMKIHGQKSFLSQTIERLLKASELKDIIIITNENYKFYVKEELGSFSGGMEDNLILEPTGRNTAPAIALAIKFCVDKLGCGDDEVIFISPSDHVISPAEKFAGYVKSAGEIAKAGHIVTFGIKPDKAETGYGYIRKGAELAGSGFRVERFVEKPDSETARNYLESGEYFWNSGMFAFTIRDMLVELERHAPEIYSKMSGNYEDVILDFGNMPNISIDYAVMEKSAKSVVLPLDLSWSDIGSWDSLCEVLDCDENRNIRIGENIMDIDTRNTLIMGNKRLISAVGLDDLIIVETDDAVLIAKRGSTQNVREIVNRLARENRKEAIEHITAYRPWGSYTVLEEGHRYKIKRITVKPGERLSLQMHYHRSEHWIVVKGTAKVTVAGEEKCIHENESTYVPKSIQHRLENPGKVPLELIEVQSGEYVGEDDIVRFEDIYGRTEG